MNSSGVLLCFFIVDPSFKIFLKQTPKGKSLFGVLSLGDSANRLGVFG
jgi:hypothetical protein